MVTSAGVIAPYGVEIAFLVASVAAAVFAGIVAMEVQRRPFVWAVIGFVTVFVVTSAVHTAL
ncbi:hypothetical protein CIW52_03760 [Mycolicibacterium sp. P9-64]|uniref:hypothetical protein n=1 Tax=Mycolicibacterium sp. P9-64 TaxID=2024612 RepID=UPI0011EF36BE|nr:hypothetical protein [Mycolicibacterium sp. P9-64]KAA0086998.1 hypothetical protein CIW52_03760 [Mycolicibacterium sp. P9-64]